MGKMKKSLLQGLCEVSEQVNQKNTILLTLHNYSGQSSVAERATTQRQWAKPRPGY